ncbi:MAG TPA: AAA family ATPase, partial [Thermomicrobiales bacterium]|nr:AAA family ATPase [Thermomicrobiales bacterium]
MRPTSDPTSHATLIGREREIDLLRASLDDACGGDGALLLICGEAGIGKTTLVRDLTRHARKRGALVLTGACDDLTTTPPYGPWIEAIRDYVPRGVQPSVPAWFGKPDEISRMGGQAALFEESRRFFTSIAEQQPLLLVLEDLHWADPATVEALRFLSRAMTDAPALIAVSYRDDEPRHGNPFAESIPSLIREANATRVELRRWPEAATREMIASGYALPEPDRDRLAAYVQQRCDGNPFFTVELLHTLESEGTLRPADGGWELGDLAHAPLPPLVRQVIEQRLSRLSATTLELAQVAAVIGQRVPFDAWLQVSGVDEDCLATAVDEVVASQLADELPGRDGIQFRHALVRDTLYGSLNGLRLQRLHAQVAETLLQLPAPDPDLVADHLDRAGDARRVDWLVRAGERAVRTFAWHSAVERFEAALRLLDNIQERRDERGWLLLRLGLLLRFSDQARSLRNIEAARDAGERTGDRALAAFARFYA